MRRVAAWVLIGLVLASASKADSDEPDGTWLVAQRVAFEIFPCKPTLCGRIVWLRDPSLRTRQMCSRTIIWGLTQDGPGVWDDGWFFDPENGSTYSVTARVDAKDRISARIYQGMSLFGRTEILTRIAPRSLPGWCEP